MESTIMVIFDSFLALLDCYDTRELFFKVYYYQLTLQKIWEENYTLYCVKNPETDLNQDEYTLNGLVYLVLDYLVLGHSSVGKVFSLAYRSPPKQLKR